MKNKFEYIITVFSRGRKEYQIIFRYRWVALIVQFFMILFSDPKKTQQVLTRKDIL